MTAAAHLEAVAHSGETAGIRAPRRARWSSILRVGALAVLLVALLAPLVLGVAGVRVLVVDGGSMAPTYGVGDVLLVTPPSGTDLVAGEPVVVGEGATRYVHRVVEVDGDRARLQGDANDAVDPGWVTQSDVTATVAVHVGGPAAALVVAAMSTEGRIALALALLFLLLVPFFPRRATGPRRSRATFAASGTGDLP
jgi:signal peptidase I